MTIAAYIPNLMDRSRVAAAAEALGLEVRFAASAAALDPQATLTIVDLGRPGVIEALSGRVAGGMSVGFASHVDGDLMRQARGAGCHRVLARSAFFSQLPTILAG